METGRLTPSIGNYLFMVSCAEIKCMRSSPEQPRNHDSDSITHCLCLFHVMRCQNCSLILVLQYSVNCLPADDRRLSMMQSYYGRRVMKPSRWPFGTQNIQDDVPVTDEWSTPLVATTNEEEEPQRAKEGKEA